MSVAVALGAHLHPGEIAAGLWLGGAQPRELVALGHRPEEALALFVGTVLFERLGGEAGELERQPDAGVGPEELLDGRQPLVEVPPRPPYSSETSAATD
jgi:hypothetical protein